MAENGLQTLCPALQHCARRRHALRAVEPASEHSQINQTLPIANLSATRVTEKLVPLDGLHVEARGPYSHHPSPYLRICTGRRGGARVCQENGAITRVAGSDKTPAEDDPCCPKLNSNPRHLTGACRTTCAL